MHVAAVLKTKGTEVVTIGATAHVGDAVARLHERQIGALPVVNGAGAIVGIFSERDVVRGLATRGPAVLQELVSTLMQKQVLVCHSGDDLKEVMGWMTRHRVRHLPVVEDGTLQGFISIGDVVKHRLEEVRTEANVLRDIVIAGH